MRFLTYVVLLLAMLLVVACGQVEPINPPSQPTAAAPTSVPTVVAVAQSTPVPTVPPTTAPTIAATLQPTPVPSAAPTSAPTVASAGQHQGATPVSTQPASSDVLVIYRKSGGFAGVRETTTVYSDGTIEVLGKDGQVQQAHVAPTEIASLKELLASLDFNAVQSSPRPPVADAFVYEISVPSSSGKQGVIRTSDGGNDAPALKEVLGMLERLRMEVK